jgi:hypothetical protein
MEITLGSLFSSLIILLNPDTNQKGLLENSENFKKCINKLHYRVDLDYPTTHHNFHIMDYVKEYGPIYLWWAKIFEINHRKFKKKMKNCFLPNPGNFFYLFYLFLTFLILAKYLMENYINEIGLSLISTNEENWIFYSEEIRYKMRKKNRKLKISFFLKEMEKKYLINLFTTNEILKLKYFTKIYSINENIVFENKLYKIYSILLISFLKDFEEQKIYLIIINNENTIIKIIKPSQIQGKPFLYNNLIINYCK